MDDLRRRFADLDRLRAPDLWDEIELRAAALGSVERVTAEPSPVRSRSDRRSLALLAVAALLVALLVTVIAVGSGLVRPPQVIPSPVVVPPTLRAPSTPIPTDELSPSPASTPTATIGRFVPAGSLVEGRAWHSALALPDGRVLLVGGEGSHVEHAGNALDSIEVWDPIGGAFTATGQMQRATYGDQYEGPHLFRMIDGRSLLIPTGCVCGPEPASTPAQVWDPASGAQPMETFAVRRVAYTATQLADGRILIAGGVPGLVGDELAAVELWDPVAGTVESTGALTFARAGAAATLLTDGRVLIVGGAIRSDGATGVTPVDEAEIAEIWDGETGTFSTAFSFETDAESYTRQGQGLYALTLRGGRVLILDEAGGRLWDPGANTLSEAGTFREARREFSATLLADGRVLVAGGSLEIPGDGRSSLASTELWDPSTIGFEPGPDLLEARAGHTATLLSDGRVLIVGGFTTAGLALDALASAELWEPGAAGSR
jgi:hypothetical protein